MQSTAKKVARFGMLTALALVLGLIDRAVPLTWFLSGAVPGIKLGLANTVLLYAIYLLDWKSAVLLMLTKVVLSGLMYGSLNAILYSLSGGVLSLAVMLFIRRAPRAGALVISLLAALPTLFFADLFVKFGGEEKSVAGDEVKVMSYNVGRFEAAAKGMNREQALAKVCEFVSREAPDVLCLQEFYTPDTVTVKHILKYLPYRCHYFFGSKGDFYGNITFSRYPIVGKGAIPFKESHNLCLWSDVRINDATVRVYNCHLQSNGLSFTNIIRRMAKKGQFTDEVKSVHERLANSNIQRSEQVGAIHDHIKASTLPTMVCGDFNDTPMSYTYHRLSSHHKDSFADGGNGFGATYSLLWPLLRIDYILPPTDVSCDRTHITRVPYSDHYPVSTLIYF